MLVLPISQSSIVFVSLIHDGIFLPSWFMFCRQNFHIRRHFFCCQSFFQIQRAGGLLHTIFCFTYSRICRKNLPCKFAVQICRANLPQGFAGYLLREFAVAICRGIFVFVSKFFLVYVTKSCFYESKPFSYVSKTFLLLRFSLSAVFFCCCCCSGSYGPPHILL